VIGAGTRLGPYEITAAIGAGGMGEVYRGRDATLNRDVAIKVLPSAMAAEPERLARFKREAQVLASLNHPNIAHVHGFEAATLADGSTAHFLAMEMVEGEDLAERLKRGAIPVDEAIAIAKQIAEGLEEAHERGIIHRDLKPANVKVTPDGKVKILDFGLAKALEGEAASGANSQLSHSPTMSRHMTEAGLIMGTAAYMSPEQARGKPVDKRADIWAFGVVIFEMLTGERLFAGETISDVLASVLKTEIELGHLPTETPVAIQALLRRCLERNPKNRLHDIADARIAIDDLLAGRVESRPQPTVATPAPLVPAWRRTLPWAVGALGLIVGITGLATRFLPQVEGLPIPVSRLLVPLPKDAPLNVEGYPGRALAISSDGTRIAYMTGDGYPDTRIRLRRLEDSEIHPVSGTELGRAAFFSPDGDWLAYFDSAEGSLKKIQVQGGRAVTLARGFANAGWMLGNWCDDGRIVFDTWNSGLRAIDGNGGEVRVLTQPKDEWHLDPQPLPGGPCRALFYVYRAGGQSIEALSLDTGERTKVLENASHGMYLASGHLLFMRDGALYLAPFDPASLKVTGPATPLAIDAEVDSVSLRAPAPQLAVARNGTLVYAASDPLAMRETRLVSMTATGQSEEIGVIPFPFPRLDLSPDGNLLASTGRQAGQPRLEVLDLQRRTTLTRLDTGEMDAPTQPLWAPDGKAILFAQYGPSEGRIVRHVLDGNLPDQTLVTMEGTWLSPTSMSADGRLLLVSRYVPETGIDIVLADLQAPQGANATKALVTTPGSDLGGVISPDSRWFAYHSNESGTDEILIEKFPERGQKTRVAAGRLGRPQWGPDGKEIYFMALGAGPEGEVDLMAARVGHEHGLRVGAPRRLFSGRFMTGNDIGQTFAVAGDGSRFILMRMPPNRGSQLGFARELMVVQNWFAELRDGTAAKKP